MDVPVSSKVQHSSAEFTVVCLCAEWCGTCREYRSEFDRLAGQFPGIRFLWRDIEEHADSLGDLDIENFPTILVRRGRWILFFGVMLPQASHLRRLIETFCEQTLEQSRVYAETTPDRNAWQKDADLSMIGLD